MSTVWVGSVDTLISMMRSPLYSTSKCTAGSVEQLVGFGGAAKAQRQRSDRCDAKCALSGAAQLLYGSCALRTRIAYIDMPHCRKSCDTLPAQSSSYGVSNLGVLPADAAYESVFCLLLLPTCIYI